MTSKAPQRDVTIGRRVAPRTKSNLMVEYKDSSGAWQRAMLADVSTTGFKLSGVGPSDFGSLWLRPVGMEPLPAKVRWSSAGSIGCEFLFPLERPTETALRELLAQEQGCELWKAVA